MYEKKESYGVTHDFNEWKNHLLNSFIIGNDTEKVFFIKALLVKPMFMLSPFAKFEDQSYSARSTYKTISEIQNIILQEETIPLVLLRSEYPRFDDDNNELFIFRGYWK